MEILMELGSICKKLLSTAVIVTITMVGVYFFVSQGVLFWMQGNPNHVSACDYTRDEMNDLKESLDQIAGLDYTAEYVPEDLNIYFTEEKEHIESEIIRCASIVKNRLPKKASRI